ncbi:uncharacterized protein LY79DRAFT_278529 [Colletotrichum navitas]|uniref:Uncharacterized protein n=1 Tax=Colletotrichum navitas TaxID=681940 RepID=A0AAD8V2S0_9PEZI|nr:uncharacterized protein LY79DRAFT_278529 [Colletotrichum navitas]KAK1585083.1 hypothetical protein LY79DRAFT_278529 [Colletotrichum navitas]
MQDKTSCWDCVHHVCGLSGAGFVLLRDLPPTSQPACRQTLSLSTGSGYVRPFQLVSRPCVPVMTKGGLPCRTFVLCRQASSSVCLFPRLSFSACLMRTSRALIRFLLANNPLFFHLGRGFLIIFFRVTVTDTPRSRCLPSPLASFRLPPPRSTMPHESRPPEAPVAILSVLSVPPEPPSFLSWIWYGDLRRRNGGPSEPDPSPRARTAFTRRGGSRKTIAHPRRMGVV